MGKENAAEADGIIAAALSHQSEHGTQKSAGQNGQHIAHQIAGGQLVKEKQHHTGHSAQHRQNFFFPQLLLEKQCADDENENGGGVLQHNGVGRRGHLVCHHEKQQAQRKTDTCAHRVFAHLDGDLFHIHIAPYHDGCKQASAARDQQGVPGDQLDKNTADAPQNGADGHQQHGFIFCIWIVSHGFASFADKNCGAKPPRRLRSDADTA